MFWCHGFSPRRRCSSIASLLNSLSSSRPSSTNLVPRRNSLTLSASMIGLGGRSIGRRRVPLIVFTIYVDAVRHRNVRGRAAGAALQRLNVQAERLQSLDHERPRRQLVADQRVVVLRPAAARDGQTLRLDLRGASLGDIRRRAGLAEHLGTANIRDGVLILDLGPQRAAVPLQVLRRTGQLRFGPETGCCWSFSASSRPSNPNSGPFSSISHQKLQNYLS